MELNDLKQVCEIDCGLAKERPLVVGVSGGPDSLCLLHVLAHLGFFCIAVHVNHQLRPEADAEAEVVKRYCEEWEIPLFLSRVNVHALAEQENLSIEESARILRYRALMQSAVQVSAQAVAVAHHADDQVETVLMHILRGAGASGLKGMSYRSFNPTFSETIPIVRPFLGVERTEILAYCQSKHINPCQDQSNSDPAFFRNRIRQELVPLLKTYNTQASRHLWQLSRLIADEDRYLDNQARKESKLAVIDEGEGYFVLDRGQFQALDRVLQRRLMRQCLASLRNNLRDIGYDPVEKAISFLLDSIAHGECQLLDDVQMAVMPSNQTLLYTDQAKFDSLWPTIQVDRKIEIPTQGDVWLNEHWKVISELLPTGQVDFQKEAVWAYFDAEALPQPLLVGTRKKGERFTPFGMPSGSMKVGDFFTNLHYPEQARRRWPILRMENHLLWIVGLRRSTLAAVKDATKQVLCMHLVYIK
jgi:tRNA(Ile)-lysidine synthase